MISELNDKEILDFLMTSDFEEDFKPEELKYFLVKYRYFYRLLYGKYKISKDDVEMLTINIEKTLKDKDIEVNNFKELTRISEKALISLRSRKLTLKERFTGKIIK